MDERDRGGGGLKGYESELGSSYQILWGELKPRRDRKRLHLALEPLQLLLTLLIEQSINQSIQYNIVPPPRILQKVGSKSFNIML